MKIGIYTGNTIPTDGGSYTLLATIKKDIIKSGCDHDIIFIYEEPPAKKIYIEDEVKYINLYIRRPILYRIIRKILRFLGIYRDPNLLNSTVKKEKISLLWLLGPFNVDVDVPYVFTVWDLGHRTQPCFPEVSIEGLTWEAREATYQKMLYKATYIITGNETGKKEILDNYPVNPEKINIIPFPVPSFCYDANDDEAIIKTDLQVPYIFYPAQFWAHKNHISLVEAVRYIRDKKNIKIHCYFVGSDKGNLNYIKDQINMYKLNDQIHILGFVDNSTLRYLYKNALAMTYVSLLGPNNLPPLEAIALGCPVIISDIPGHIEQMEGTSLAVNATNSKFVGEAIYRLYSDNNLRNKMIFEGQTLAMKYRDYSYFGRMLEIIDQYGCVRKTWN